MSLRSELSRRFGDAFAALGLDRSYGEVVVSQRPDLAQYQVNGALAAAKSAGRPPREIAEAVVERVAGDDVAELSVAGPGFINITVADETLARHVAALVDEVGSTRSGPSRRILIDYGGPNISKALHAGHLRSAIIGDALKRLFRVLGHEVVGDIHLGDWGMPIGQLIVALELRRPDLPYFDPEYTGPYPDEPPVDIDELSELYPWIVRRCRDDAELADRARRATLELQRGREGYVALWRHFLTVSLAAQRRDFDALGIDFDLWYGESTVRDRLEPMVERLVAAGVAVESEGALIVEVAEPDDAKEVPPLLLTRSDGSYLYTTTDLATVELRAEEGYDVVLYVVDHRQSLHLEQVFRAARKAGIAPPDMVLEHVAFGTLNGPDGRPFKTREGGVLLLSDLIALVEDAARRRLEDADLAQDYPEEERERIAHQVGIAALKFGDLANHRLSSYVFDLDRFTSFEGKTGPYLQYGAVRMKSILRKAEERELRPGPILAPEVDRERALMLTLVELPDVLARAAELRAPNHVADLAYRLAGDFNRFYEACHVLREEDPKRQASWLGLVETTLRSTTLLLDLLGIEVPERM